MNIEIIIVYSKRSICKLASIFLSWFLLWKTITLYKENSLCLFSCPTTMKINADQHLFWLETTYYCFSFSLFTLVDDLLHHVYILILGAVRKTSTVSRIKCLHKNTIFDILSYIPSTKLFWMSIRCVRLYMHNHIRK